MNTGILPGVVAVVLVSIATLAIGTFGLRISRTTSDFLVASRSVRPRLNASAIGGEVEALYTNGPAGGGGASRSVRRIVGILSTFIRADLVTSRVEFVES